MRKLVIIQDVSSQLVDQDFVSVGKIDRHTTAEKLCALLAAEGKSPCGDCIDNEHSREHSRRLTEQRPLFFLDDLILVC